jgi:hypothetical protein
MKNKGVCDGCMYHRSLRDAPMLGKICDFASMEGKSRIAIEMENGGIKKDSCICKCTNEREKKKAGWKWRNF